MYARQVLSHCAAPLAPVLFFVCHSLYVLVKCGPQLVSKQCVTAGVLNYLKETFTHTPSYDMSPAMLSVLTKMMLAQAQESVFEKVTLPGIRNEFFMLVKVAQEAAKVRLPGRRDCQGGWGARGPAGGTGGSLPPTWAACPPRPRLLACVFSASTGVSGSDR